MDPTTRLIARTLQPARGQAWHGGPTPVGALRGVTAAAARWRPHPKRHSIWELALHAAYWKYAVRRRLLGGEIGGFPRSPANWPELPTAPNARAWEADKALLAAEHRLLLQAIERFPGARLGRSAGGRKRWTWGDLIVGIAMHDAYHAGQIQMLKRLWAVR
ncbi:MAG: DinB family protein [Gemmatimonadales bacterium]|nr:DinB family protein [Gemmatimonadales bacterium]